MKKDYVNYLEQNIYNWINQNNREPNHIVINPDTWRYLASDIVNKTKNELYNYDFFNNNKFRDYKIFRSHDVKEDVIEIG